MCNIEKWFAMKVIGRVLLVSFFSCLGIFDVSWASSQQVDLKKRDLQYLENLKQELAKAESMPGGLEYARQIQRQIQTIEQGTTIYTPELNHGQRTEKPTVADQSVSTQNYPKRADKGVLSLTEGGKDLDLFHEKTITVAEDYGVSREAMQAHKANKKQENDDLYTPLEIPNDERLYEPEPVLPHKGAMHGPLYGFPVQGSHSTIATPTITEDPTHTSVDAAQFQQKQQPLYGNPHGAGMHPSNSVVPPHMAYTKDQEAWKGGEGEVGYLEEQLKTKLSQLVHARRQLESATGQEANAWTSRIHDIEAEKRSLIRMMARFGATPSFTKVSLKEDSEFDTIQSQEHLLKRQLYKTEKEEKKLRRQMHGVKDAEALTVMGERLASLERDRKLLETSLRTLQQNTENVDRTAFVSRPTVYGEAEEKKDHGSVLMGSTQEQTDRTGHPDYIERLPQHMKKHEKIVDVENNQKAYTAHSQGVAVVVHPEEEEDDVGLHQERNNFWTAGLPDRSDHYNKIPVEKPQPVDREEARAISAIWNVE